MRTARGAAAGAVVGDRLYVAGGTTEFGNENEPIDSLEIYDFARRRWLSGPPMPTPRHHFGVGAIDGRLFFAGGRQPENLALAAFEEFDPASGRWWQGPDTADRPRRARRRRRRRQADRHRWRQRPGPPGRTRRLEHAGELRVRAPARALDPPARHAETQTRPLDRGRRREGLRVPGNPLSRLRRDVLGGVAAVAAPVMAEARRQRRSDCRARSPGCCSPGHGRSWAAATSASRRWRSRSRPHRWSAGCCRGVCARQRSGRSSTP